MWLSDFRLVLPDRVIERGALRIEDGRIAEIREAPVPGADRVGRGLLLMPGFIDMHGDMIEREVEPRPGVRMPLALGLRDLDRRLKVAGVTTAYAAVSFQPGSAYGHVRHFETDPAPSRWRLRVGSADLERGMGWRGRDGGGSFPRRSSARRWSGRARAG